MLRSYSALLRPDIRLHSQLSLLALVALVLLAGCGGASSSLPGSAGALQAESKSSNVAWPISLPRDAVQPWEQLTPAGVVQPVSEHASSAINGGSVFVPGVERFAEGGDVTDSGEASQLRSGVAGERGLSFAIYRLALAGEQPGVVSADANLLPLANGQRSSYYLGVSDYAAGRWEWHGPFSDNHIRLGRSAAGATGAGILRGSDYLSPLGNLFLAVLAYDAAAIDLVGVSANPGDTADVTAPQIPGGLTAAPVVGGIQLQWNGVLAPDLAGYRIYWSQTVFTDPHNPGVQQLDYLEGTTLHVLELPATGAHSVAVAAVDLSGNESAVSDVVTANALPGSAQQLVVTVDAASAMRGDPVTITATGAQAYTFDLDGDGVMDSANQTGINSADTTAAGLVRPAVFGTGADNTMTALGGVSVIVVANSRPVASAVATPSSGAAPLNVTLAGEAEDLEDDAAALTYSWDFNGDGIFEAGTDTLTPPVQAFAAPGLYNVKFRVMDSAGAWDVDTVSVLVNADPSNQPPQIAALGANPSLATPGTQVQFSSSATDPDGVISSYAWDFDNDGAAESSLQNPAHTFAAAGLYNVHLTVTDVSGASVSDLVSVSIEDNPANYPPVITQFGATPAGGDAPLAVSFDFDATDSDGSVAEFAIDYQNDGTFDFTSATSGTHNTNYNAQGFFTACLRVTDDLGATSRSFISIYATPVGANVSPVVTRFSAVPASGAAPLSVTFHFSGTDADGSLTEFAIDYEDNGSFDFTTAAAGSVSHDYSTLGLTNARLRVTDNDGATSSSYTSIFVSETDTNIPPVALLAADRTIALMGTSTAASIEFDASASYDPEGGALDYAFDFDGDGSFTSFSSDATLGGSYSAPGTYLTVVKVQDPAGKQSVGTMLVKVYRLNPQVIDTNANVADASAIVALSNTLSARIGCAYSDTAANDNLLFALCMDQAGSDWQAPYVLDANGGEFMSFVQGISQFSLAYYRDDDLFFKASQNDGSSFNINATVDTGAGDDVGNYCSALIVSSSPAISYHNETDGDLYYIRASNSSGSAWANPGVLVDGTGDTGEFTSLQIVGSRPAIAYYRRDTGNLVYVRASDTTGSAWGAPVKVDNSADDVGQYASMAIVNGNPAIAYWNLTTNSLRYVRATDSSGNAWGTPLTVITNTGKFCRLAVTNGRVVVFYSNASSSGIFFVESTDNLGSTWGGGRRIDAHGNGVNMSLTLMTNGQPLSAYQSSNAGAKVAVAKLE